MHRVSISLLIQKSLQILILASAACWFVRAYMNALRRRPRLRKSDIVYQEWFASGSSEKNFLAKLGGARNCLRLVVTNDILWVLVSPPFSPLSVVYDLEHVIPLSSIQKVERSKKSKAEALLLTYSDDLNIAHTLRLVPRHQEEFLHSLGVNL